ncbi:crotonobetainyl-CoA:carnitine CoA-transferase CaiB-like acyl-CoA transferase [Rhodoligotrophos appendicifer]|uniref:CaiB/BaiF CoA transferase family protein n=1 Tax=Rhodoligotrophos appendicifer TaxID=987056 RepID=UPI0019617663|nr:CaiB/BaiF CoA-transferase family protein [Rhodoligotrophos appendicifer]
MKLTGLRVVDLSVFLPGPYLTMSLADHGAEVIKVEAPGIGDPAREIGKRDGPSTVFFRNFNRGKRSVVLDLKTEVGRLALLRLVDRADVFVEAFRPGVMARLGLDFESLARRNPRLVYCSISAFGQEGPYRDRPAHDLATEALGGILSINLGHDGTPAIPGLPAADLLSALQGLSGILMALYRRERTGQGDFLDISMQASILAACPNIVGSVFAEGLQPVVENERSLGGSAFYQVYQTADRRHLVLGGQEIKFVRNLLDAFGRPDFVSLCEMGPGPHQAPLVAFLREKFREKTLVQWSAWFEGRDICFAPVNSLPEAFDDPQAKAFGTLHTDELGRKHLAPAIRFRNERASPNWKEPTLGEATAQYCGSLSP